MSSIEGHAYDANLLNFCTMKRQRDLLIGLGLILAVIACYWQVSGHEFINYDDHRYITRNDRVQQGLTWANLAWAFTSFEVANWHPLTWLSHMADVTLFGKDNAGAHHLVNVALHLANTILLFLILRRMTGCYWRSALVTALFALHPLHVESVAWVSERKDVLSTFFGLLAIAAHLAYVSRPSWKQYACMACLFALSLMSKPMLVTLPFVLLLLDYWPLRRFQISNLKSAVPLVLEKLPLVALSIGSAVVTMFAQIRGGSVSGFDAVPVMARLINATVAYATYLWQAIRPLDLIPLYPLPRSWPAPVICISIAVMASISALAFAMSRKRPWLIIGWLWYLGTLLPVIGLIQVGSQAHADRYTYVPLIGVFIMIAWSIPALRRNSMAVVYGVSATILLAAMSYLTYLQVGYWHDSITLSKHALRIAPDNTYVHFNLGNAYIERSELDQALPHFERAAELMPRWDDPHFNMGNALRRAGRLPEAVAAYQEAVRRRPDQAANRLGLGNTLAMSRRIDEAIPHFERALELDPGDPTAHMSMAAAMVEKGWPEQARPHLEVAATLARERGYEQLLREIHRRLQRLDQSAEAP